MKKLSILFLSVVALGTTTFTSCSKDDDKPAPPTTSLELTVKQLDNAGALLEGATVDLYETPNDWSNKENAIKTLTTDVNGKVKFTGLEGITYYFRVNKGCVNNDLYGILPVATKTALVSGENLAMDSQVIATGKVKVTNMATDKDWDITIPVGNQYATLYTVPASATGTVTMPANGGNLYTVHMVEFPKDGDTSTGVTKDINVTVNCGELSTDELIVP